MQSKMYFFVPFVRPCTCMHHKFGVISGSHACRVWAWPIIFGAELYSLYNLPWRASVNSHQVQCNIPTFEASLKRNVTCFLKDAESLATYGWALYCSKIVYIRLYSLNPTIAFYFLTECSDVTVFVRLRAFHATAHSHFTWPWPMLDSASYSECSVVPSVTG